jgi:hypothetical protein
MSLGLGVSWTHFYIRGLLHDKQMAFIAASFRPSFSGFQTSYLCIQTCLQLLQCVAMHLVLSYNPKEDFSRFARNLAAWSGPRQSGHIAAAWRSRSVRACSLWFMPGNGLRIAGMFAAHAVTTQWDGRSLSRRLLCRCLTVTE